MTRSNGVTASAVISILGSICTALLGLLFALVAIIMGLVELPSPVQQPAVPISTTVVLVAESIFFVGLGTIGIICAVGLLRLRNWARISFLVFGSLLELAAGMCILGGVAVLLFLPSQPNLSPGMVVGIMFSTFFLHSCLQDWAHGG